MLFEGLDEAGDDAFRARFDPLSSLKAEDGKPANLAQINRRMQLDAELINRICGRRAIITRSSGPPCCRPKEEATASCG